MDAEMERWRSFFAQAEGDLWAIIDQAILIAAADFPAEFKHKRCEIAEVLFARRRIPSPPSRSIEATRLSGSVITNATADGEKRTSQTWMEEVNGSMHPNTAQIELKRTDTHSHEIVSKTSANGVHIMHEDKSVELHRCLQNGDDSRESSKDSGVLDSVSMIKDVITDPANQNENDLLRSLRVLEHLDINVGILKATDIGREVNKFRKHSSVHVRNLVKQLVRTWKGIVDEWARNTEDDGSLNESRGQDVKGKEAQMQASMQLTKTLNTTNTDSRMRAHTYSEHVIEEMGSSRVESDDLYKAGFADQKADCFGQQVQFSKSMPIKGRTGNVGPGRHADGIHGVFKNEQYQESIDKHRVCHQGDGSQKSGHGKFTSLKIIPPTDQGMLEDLRRLPSEGQPIEPAKKQQRVLPLSNNSDPAKRACLGARLPAYTKPQHYTQKR